MVTKVQKGDRGAGVSYALYRVPAYKFTRQFPYLQLTVDWSYLSVMICLILYVLLS